MNPAIGHHHIWSPSLPSILHLYLCHIWVHTSCTHRMCSFCHVWPFYRGIICRCDSTHNRTFNINPRARASAHAYTLSRNVCARASKIIRAPASINILARTYACLCVRAWDPTSIRACALLSIHACGGCSVFLSIIISSTLLVGDLGHGSRTVHVYIQGALGDSLYHILESPERCYLNWLGEEICIRFPCWAVFQGQVHVINMILYKEVSHSDVLFILCTLLFTILIHKHSTHVINLAPPPHTPSPYWSILTTGTVARLFLLPLSRLPLSSSHLFFISW